MLIVRVELHSARTGEVTEIARAQIINDGTGTPVLGNYWARSLRGRTKAGLDRRTTRREARVEAYPRATLHVWNLVARALLAMGYK